MTLRFKNTMGNRVEEFQPLKPGEVRIYTCGPTVYGFAHIGNYRTYMFEDLLRRWLKYRGYTVTQVMNLTDVDDKTIRESRKEGIPLDDYTARYKKAFFEDLDTLGIERAEVYPAATEHIPEMVTLVQKLMDKGLAYRGSDGCIYYSIEKFPDYGKLSGKRIDKNIAGARIAHDEYEKDEAADFALWKAWDEGDGDVFWETELGKGRPGWHIECSAMSTKYLGETFDIHTGGEDNIFPHHENEIAQSEAANGVQFVRYWLHSAHLIVEGKKMSKSLGNFYTLRQLLDKGYNPLTIRYELISTHYRQQLNFTFEGLDAARNSINRLREFRAMLDSIADEGDGSSAKILVTKARTDFEAALDDDLNISGALGAVFELVREANKLRDEGRLTASGAKVILAFLDSFHTVTGLLPEEIAETVPVLIDGKSITIEEAIALRAEARAAKDWPRADAVRDAIADAGYIIKDTPDGTIWRRNIVSN